MVDGKGWHRRWWTEAGRHGDVSAGWQWQKWCVVQLAASVVWYLRVALRWRRKLRCGGGVVSRRSALRWRKMKNISRQKT